MIRPMDRRWRIREFAARTGVPEVTLRAWERRYGLLDPERSSGGYRLFGADDERRVRAMQAHMSRGVAAAEAAQLALTEAGVDEVPADPTQLSADLLAAVAAFDATRADALLGGAFALGPAPAVRDVVLPVLREIGDRWASGEMTVGHEHFASHLVERRLMQHAARWDQGGGRLALLACAPGERHTLGLMCFGVALSERGWRVASLGGDTPVEHIHQAAAALGPDVVVVSATRAEPFTTAAKELRALAREHRLVIGGAGATAAVARRLAAARAPDDPVIAAEELASTAV